MNLRNRFQIHHSQSSGFRRLAVAFRIASRFTILVLSLLAVGCNDEKSPAVAPSVLPSNHSNSVLEKPSLIRFEDVAEPSGLHFVPQNGRPAGLYTIVESLGTGTALADLDGDGTLDVIAPGGGTFDENGSPVGTRTGIFRQKGSLTFEDIAAATRIDTGAAYTHGVTTADWNNDGFCDVVITGYHAVRMFQNSGDGTFIDVTFAVGIEQSEWATSAAFLDADNDGDLELYVVNYVDWEPDLDRRCVVDGRRDTCPPGQFTAASDRLYDNNGEGGFRESSPQAGLIKGGKGLAVLAGDIDIDGDTDIYVANDTNANFLYLNDGTGVFTEQALVSGCALGATMEAEGSMGVALADFDADGLPDIWVSNYERQSFALYQSRAPGIFQHVSAVTGISAVGRTYVGFGTVALDADLDGDQDIFAANGHVMYESESAPLRQFPLFYENQNGERFRNVAADIGEYGRSTHMGRGVSGGDLDGDGRVDLVVAHMNEPISVLRNISNHKKDWVSVRLIGTRTARSAIGAVATVNGQLATCTDGGSYLSDSDDRLIWAVPHGTERVKVDVTWPSGGRQTAFLRSRTLNSVIEGLEGSEETD